jgi:ABC-2 type transport system ATP-binding protein
LPETRIRPLTSGWLSPATFIALRKVEATSGLVGSARLRLEQATDTPLLFASLAVRRIDGDIEVLSEQVTPLNARQIDLAAASALLQPGDELGLRVSGFSGQYLFNSSWNPRAATLRGDISLPPLLPLARQ